MCRLRVCPDCERSLPLTAFNAKEKWPDGSMRWPHYRCKVCERAHRRARRAGAPAATPLALVPGEPFREWLRTLGPGALEIADASGLHVENVRAILRPARAARRVSLDTVDRATLHAGVPLGALYPDL